MGIVPAARDPRLGRRGGLAVVVAGVCLVVAMRAALVDEVRSAARLQAAQLAGQVEQGRAPSLAVDAPDEQLVQVTDAAGLVVASSDGATGRPAVARLRAGESAKVRDVFEDDDAVVAAARAGDGTVLVALSVDEVGSATSVVAQLLALGLPLLLLVVALTSWRLTGRALAPVEAIRSEVDAISAGELHRRVPTGRGGDEVARLAATMNRMLGRLEDSAGRQRRFVSDASHELRTPIASIRQHAEVALAHPESTTVSRLAATVLVEDLRTQRLVEDLLMLARADEDGLRLTRQPVDVDYLALAEALRLRQTTRLRIDTTGVTAGRVLGDEAALRRVLQNLTDNGSRHAVDVVALTVTTHDREVVLSVEDDGPGIVPADRQRVLERFVRIDQARLRATGGAGGAGLGLSIVTEVVAAHAGRLVIGDSPLGGVRISVHLSEHD